MEKLLGRLIKEYQEDFEKEPPLDNDTKSFRQGMIFAWKLAQIKLKEEEKENV